ncbi:MAG: tetratricopeptide repeat protein, partial [Burkholderiales bacterium]|nr:tetratricopeptide repeat protein [Anaerolineae bacterium]
LIPQTVLTTLGLREESGLPVLEMLTHYLRTKKVLLILDNCEHLVQAAAQFADALLQDCINLRLLVSSREALGIVGEKAYHVRSLSTPKADAPPSVETASQYESINLFVDRAKTVSSTFAITPANVSAVAQICVRLDGIPLAIELAAARVKMLKAEQIAERLDDRFRLLTGGSRTALPRQQTLRAMIDWSYDLLPESERVLLRRLSVFAGGWTLEAAETVCQGSGIDDYNILDPLTQLVNKSLVVVDADDNTETRYRLLETVRQYAREKLSETGEGMTVRDAHLQYFLGLAERAEPEGHGSRVLEWVNRLEAELDNIRSALAWSLKRDALVGLRLANALHWFWDERGYVNDLLNWLEQLLKQPDTQAHTMIRARALGIQGSLSRSHLIIEESLTLCGELGDKQGQIHALIFLANLFFIEDPISQQGLQLLKESLMLSRELGDKPLCALTLQRLGTIVGIRKEYEQAYRYLEESLAIFREMGDLIGAASSLSALGILAIRQANYPTAHRWLEESLAIKDQLGKGGTSIFSTLKGMGQLCYWEGDYAQALLYHERSLSIVQETGVSWDQEKWELAFLGYAALRHGDIAYARNLFVKSQQLSKKENYTIGLIFVSEGLASLATLQGQPIQAAQLFAFTDTARESLGDTRPPNEQAEVNRDLATVHAQIDEATFAAAQEAGRAMSMDEAIALALESTHD